MPAERFRTHCASLLVAGTVALWTGPPLVAQQGALASVASLARTAGTVEAAPTFYADVLPILQENCQACHQPAGLNMGGMVAPMSFLTYEDTRPWASTIAKVITEGKMPPWSASEMHRGTFKGERYLEDDEKATLTAWADAGAPAGDPADAPPAPDLVAASRAGEGGWFLGEPDLVVEFDEPYCLSDDVEDLYVDVPAHITAEMLPEDRWIQSVEYRPGPAVHHILGGVGGLVPGALPRVYEDGYGRLFQAGPREITFNMHFHKTAGPGTAICSNTQAGIIFKKPGEVIRYVTGGDDLGMFDFVIPAGAESYSSSHEYVFDHDVEILSLLPHMHLRGKAALYELTYPDGRNRILLHVPDYDFNWQHTYQFNEPVPAPAGSRLRFTLWWDNSTENPYNPDPTIDVHWGRPTTAEMGFGYMSFRELEERHIVVGEPIPAEVRDTAATANSDSDGN